MKIYSLFLLLSFALINQSCDRCERGRGAQTTEIRVVPSFESVELKGSNDVKILKSSDGSFEVKVDEYSNLQAYIITEVVNNQLIIRTKDNICLRNSVGVITVKMPEPLYSVVLSGSGNIDIEGIFSSITTVSLSGSGNISNNEICHSNSLNMVLGGSGNINFGSLYSQNANILLSGSGNIDLTGSGSNYNCQLTGSGNISAYNFATSDAVCSLTGSGNIEVNAQTSLNATLSGSGDIRYTGTPAITQNVTGSGSVRPR